MASELGLKPQVYTLQDFVRISDTVDFDIHEDVIAMINMLADKVGAPSYQRTPNFKTVRIVLADEEVEISVVEKNKTWKLVMLIGKLFAVFKLQN